METAVWMDRERKSEAEREMEREWKGEKINVRIKKSLMNVNVSSLFLCFRLDRGEQGLNMCPHSPCPTFLVAQNAPPPPTIKGKGIRHQPKGRRVG